MENIRKIAILLAPDDKGLQEVFGLSAVALRLMSFYERRALA